jgi:hypothetical protein
MTPMTATPHRVVTDAEAAIKFPEKALWSIGGVVKADLLHRELKL